MNIRSVYSAKQSVKEVVDDIKNQLNEFETKMLIFFASSTFTPEELSKSMQDSFSSSSVFGCSTSGEIISGKMLKSSVVAMAFNSNAVKDVKVEIVENIKTDASVKKAFDSFERYYNEPASMMDINKYAGIVLIDGLSGSEEKVMDKIGDRTNLTFIGGSAGDDLKFSQTYIYADGKTYTNAALLALLKLQTGFDIIKTQSFEALDKRLVATKVNEQTREVIEFNNKPAALAYAEALGVTIEDLPNHFMSNPVGLLVGDEIYVRSPQQLKDTNVVFYCNILEGMEVAVLKSTDIVKDTKQAVENMKNQLGGISAIINFNCILRTLELENKNQTQQYGEIFSSIPTIGFSTYGEAYIGHINQTSTMLVFK